MFIGAFGWFGITAAITDSILEWAENPIRFLD